MEESLQQVAAYQCDSCHLIYASGLAECGVAGGEDDDQKQCYVYNVHLYRHIQRQKNVLCTVFCIICNL